MNQYGNTPLRTALINGNLPMVKYLLKRGADTEARDYVSGVII